jgi:hypothetical protein
MRSRFQSAGHCSPKLARSLYTALRDGIEPSEQVAGVIEFCAACFSGLFHVENADVFPSGTVDDFLIEAGVSESTDWAQCAVLGNWQVSVISVHVIWV